MMAGAKSKLLLLAGAASLLVGGAQHDAKTSTAVAKPAQSATSANFALAPSVALVTTRPGATESSWWLAHRAAAPTKLGHFSHGGRGDVRATVLARSDHSLVATAPTNTGRDRSFDGGLWRLDANGTAQQLCLQVAHASRPLVTPAGQALVARGVAGPTLPDQMRVDDLTIDAIDPASGAITTLLHQPGYLLHLAGIHGGEVIVYRLAPAGADLIAIDLTTGVLRSLLSPMVAFARDFSVDHAGGRLIFRNRHETDSRRWVVDALELTPSGSGAALKRLYSGTSFSLAPHAWPGGAVAINPGQRGLRLLSSSDPVSPPLGPGVDLVSARSQDPPFVAIEHSRAGKLSLPYLLDRYSGAIQPLPFGRLARVAIAGFVDAKSGGQP